MELTKIEKKTGIILAILLFLITMSSTLFFLGQLKVNFLKWIVINSCSPNSLLYLLFFIITLKTKKAIFLVLTFVPIYFLGTLSMFVMPWNESTFIAHIGHIIMTFNLIWAVYVIIRHCEYKALALGLLISIVCYAPYVASVLNYNQANSDELIKLLQ